MGLKETVDPSPDGVSCEQKRAALIICLLTPHLVVSYDLGSQAMVHGKKGFDRLVYACKNVLDQPLTWLFCDMAKPCASSFLF